jgi:hypothetical protein
MYVVLTNYFSLTKRFTLWNKVITYKAIASCQVHNDMNGKVVLRKVLTNTSIFKKNILLPQVRKTKFCKFSQNVKFTKFNQIYKEHIKYICYVKYIDIFLFLDLRTFIVLAIKLVKLRRH